MKTWQAFSFCFDTQDSDKYETCKELSGVCRLTIKNCELEDGGDYSCRIEKQEDKTSTVVTIVGEIFVLLPCKQYLLVSASFAKFPNC